MTRVALTNGTTTVSDLPRGRTRIAPHALNRIVAAVSAHALGVGARQVDVTLVDDHGLLALIISTPISTPPLTQIRRDAGLLAQTGGSLIERTETARRKIRDNVTALTEAHLGSITVELTKAAVRTKQRVS